VTVLRLLLNSDFSGANAFFALADADGSLRAAGLDLQFTAGRGAWTAAERLADGEFDLAYGDVNALIGLLAARGEEELPLAIFMVHQHAPSTIAVARAGSIHAALDLAGQCIIGHASDVALQTFPVFARACGLAGAAVTIRTSAGPMRELLLGMLEGQADAVFGYVTTHKAALASAGRNAAGSVRFLTYRQACPSLYGSALMAAPWVMREQPQRLWRLVRVLRSSIVSAQANPEAALAAVLAKMPAAVPAIESERWQGTLLGDMGLNAAPMDGFGDVDDGRLAAGVSELSAACGWRSMPDVRRVFTRKFLGAVTPVADDIG
jgi:NitT/TauT family transport system substrate-binding protein